MINVRKNWILVLPAAVAVVGCNSGSNPISSSGAPTSLAVVNGEEIPMSDFHGYLERKQRVTVVTPDGQTMDLPLAGSLALQGMRDMVNRKLIVQMAKEEGVAPTDAEIKAEIDFQTKLRPDYVNQLKNAGLSLEEITEDLRVDLAQFKLITKGITVTQTDVDKFIKDNEKAFVNPSLAEVYIVVVRDAKQRQAVDADLKAGQQFPVVAARYSVDPNARRSNGLYPIREVEQMPEQIRVEVEKLKAGQTSDWKTFGSESVRFFVQSKTPSTPMKIDDLKREEVKRQLMVTRGSAASSLNEKLSERARNAKVEVKVDYLAPAWKRLSDQMKQSDAAAAAQQALESGKQK